MVPRAADGGPRLDELRDWVKEELPAWCAPRELVLVDEIPRTALGKPRRDALLGAGGPGSQAVPRTPAPPSIT